MGGGQEQPYPVIPNWTPLSTGGKLSLSYLWNGYTQVGKPQSGGDGMGQQETLMLVQTLSTRDPDELAEGFRRWPPNRSTAEGYSCALCHGDQPADWPAPAARLADGRGD
jgi:hypothetical protein